MSPADFHLKSAITSRIGVSVPINGLGRKKKALTSIDILPDRLRLLARRRLGGRLRLQLRAAVVAAAGVQRALQGVPLPPEHVVPVPPVPRAVVHAVHERLAAVLRPQRRVVELPRVPHHFVHHLRQAHGVRRGARGGGLEGAAGGVGDVAFVVGAVEVLAVPAPT